MDRRPLFGSHVAGECLVRPVYFDYNATTPLDPDVRAAMLPYLDEIFGNPSSVHHVGRRARALLDDARDRFATVCKSKPSEIIFTSGGTESNNLAIFGAARHLRNRGRHIVTSAIEHHAVLNCCEYLESHEGFDVTYLPVMPDGRVTVESVMEAIRPDTVLVSIMAANNETGTLQPVAAIGAACRRRGILFHTDAVQWVGKEPWKDIHQFNADLVAICAHKIHGPKGAGALFIRSPLLPQPLLFGGGHENERRAGTENLPAIVGLTEAMERFVVEPVFDRGETRRMTARLTTFLDTLAEQGVMVRGSRTERLCNTVAFTVRGSDSIALLAGLDLEGVCASSGSACSSGALEPSHVMKALQVDRDAAQALVRFSLGRESTWDDVAHVETVLPRVVARAQTYQ